MLHAPTNADKAPELAAPSPNRAQRRCTCGGVIGPDGQCAACRAKRERAKQMGLRMGRAGDAHEQAAERAARQVTNAYAAGGMPSLRVSPSPAGDVPAPQSVMQAVSQSGRRLDPGTRAFMQQRFGVDFGHVRVHRDREAAASAREIGAAAYTVGRDVVFGEGQFAPHSQSGMRLIAHELAHVVQQSEARQGVVQRQDELLGRDSFGGGSFGGGGASASIGPLPVSWRRPPSPPSPPPDIFFHGSTWRTVQTIPGNVQPIGGGDFGQGFYTHHDQDSNRAADRARLEGCRFCQKLRPPERYAGVVRFDVPHEAYTRLFDNRRTFGLTSTTQPDYAARQREWLDFVSGPGRGREPTPSFDVAHLSWRHQRVDPPPDQGFDLIEGPFYRGVEGLPGPDVPPRSAFRPYEEGTSLPQQVVWNHDRAMAVLNAARTSLSQYDAANNCQPVSPPVNVPPLDATVPEDPVAREEARREMMNERAVPTVVRPDLDWPCPSCHAMQRAWERERRFRQFELLPSPPDFRRFVPFHRAR